jgi:hypothetical protein
VPPLRHLPTRVTDGLAPRDERDLSGFAEVALRDLRASLHDIRECSELLDTSIAADEPRRLELHKVNREIRAQAEVVANLIDAAFQPEAS